MLEIIMIGCPIRTVSNRTLSIMSIEGGDMNEDILNRLNSREVLIDQLPNLISAFNDDEEQDFLQVLHDFGTI